MLVTSDSVTGQVDLPECNGAVPRPSFFAVLVLVFVAMMMFESDYTLWMRNTFFGLLS